MILAYFLLKTFGVGVSCRILDYFIGYLYVSSSGSITSVGEERANLSAVGEASSSSGRLGWATLFYCGTPP